MNWDQLSLADISQRLLQQKGQTYDIAPAALGDNPREAAVLIPFIRIDDSWHILYIRRTQFDGDQHSGQVAFAGGKHEHSDTTLEQTALREAQEEIGLKQEDVNILGQLNKHHTISHFRVTPYVAHIAWPYAIEMDTTEVARVFSIPLNWLADPTHHRTELRYYDDSSSPWPVVYYQPYDGELLWGASARMTRSLIDCLEQGAE